jgi:hypothetical protein
MSSPMPGPSARSAVGLYVSVLLAVLLSASGMAVLLSGERVPGAAGSSQGAAAPAAGWYPDPSGGPELRYWDGARWTEHSGNE